MKLMRLSLLCLTSLLCHALVGYGEDPTDQIFVDQVLKLNFAPRKAYFIFSDGPNRLLRVAAQPMEIKASAPESQAQLWILAAFAPHLAEHSKLDFISAVCSSVEDSSCHLYRTQADSQKRAIPAVTVSDLREYLLQRKRALEEQTAREDEQQRQLRRLRDDADAIGDIGRIIDAKDELAKTEGEIANLEQDLKTLNSFLGLTKIMPIPLDYALREAELSKDITRLTESTRALELGGAGQISSAQREFQAKLEAIESTRDEDVDALKRELSSLRNRPGKRRAPPEEEPEEETQEEQ